LKIFLEATSYSSAVGIQIFDKNSLNLSGTLLLLIKSSYPGYSRNKPLASAKNALAEKKIPKKLPIPISFSF